jgi:preprotein translocase SecE subunit
VKALQKIVDFVKEAYEELKNTQWPNREKTIRLTLSVIVIGGLTGLFVSFWDYIFKELLVLLVNR